MALDLPVVNGSSGTWGSILNAALTDIDSRLSAAIIKNNDQDTALNTVTGRVNTLEANTGGKLTVVTGVYPTLAAGQIFLDTNNGYLSYVASVSGVPTRVPFPGSYVAKLKRTTTQNYGNNSAGALNFNAADTDRLGGWSSGTPTRYTATVPGAYEFTGAISYAANATGYRSTTWYLNGAAQNSSSIIIPAVTGESTVVNARPCILKLNVGDYVELYGYQNSGSTVTTDATTANQPSIQVKYLGYNA